MDEFSPTHARAVPLERQRVRQRRRGQRRGGHNDGLGTKVVRRGSNVFRSSRPRDRTTKHSPAFRLGKGVSLRGRQQPTSFPSTHPPSPSPSPSTAFTLHDLGHFLLFQTDTTPARSPRSYHVPFPKPALAKAKAKRKKQASDPDRQRPTGCPRRRRRRYTTPPRLVRRRLISEQLEHPHRRRGGRERVLLAAASAKSEEGEAVKRAFDGAVAVARSEQGKGLAGSGVGSSLRS